MQDFFNYKSKNIAPKTIAQIVLVTWLLKLMYGLVILFYTNGSITDFSSFASLYCYNDSGWYQNIAENWYPVVNSERDLGYLDDTGIHQSSWAFFPLYPALVKFFMYLFSCDFYVATFLWSIILVPLATTLFFKLVISFKDDRKFAWFVTMLLLLIPFHYQFFMSYTEALFLFGLFAAIIGIYQQHYFFIILGTSILVLTRPNGVLTLLPLWLLNVEQLKISFRTILNNIPLIIKKSLVFLPAGILFFGYLYYQYSMTGYFNAFSIAQRGWGKSFMFPVLAFFKHATLENQVHSLYCLLIMIFSLWQIKKMPLSLNLLVWLNILLPLTAGSTISMGRYLIVLFPLWFLIGNKLYQFSKVRYLILIILLGIQLYLIQYWPIQHSMGY